MLTQTITVPADYLLVRCVYTYSIWWWVCIYNVHFNQQT